MKLSLNKKMLGLGGLVFLAIGFTIIFSACGKNEPVQLGFIAGLSGRVADLGVAGRNGVMLAIEQKNAQGGIDGRPVELIVRDDQQNPDIVKKMTQELLNQNVRLIIGPMTSSMAMAAVPMVNQARVCMLSPTCTTTYLLDTDDFFLRVISTTKDYATKSAAYQSNALGKRKAVAIYDLKNKAYTESWLHNFKETFEQLGGKVIKISPFKSGDDIVFYDNVNELLKSEPDLFVIITNAVDAALICQQIRKISDHVNIAMAEWASTERFVELAGSAAEGVYVAQFLDRNDSSVKYQAFRKAYLDRFGQEPGFAGIAGYDAGIVVLAALSDQKKGEHIKDTIIRKKTFKCVQETITINEFGDANRKTFVSIIKDGQYVTLE